MIMHRIFTENHQKHEKKPGLLIFRYTKSSGLESITGSGVFILYETLLYGRFPHCPLRYYRTIAVPNWHGPPCRSAKIHAFENQKIQSILTSMNSNSDSLTHGIMASPLDAIISQKAAPLAVIFDRMLHHCLQKSARILLPPCGDEPLPLTFPHDLFPFFHFYAIIIIIV